jgi:hypothetical protein
MRPRVIAERTYQLRTSSGERSVTVRFGHPVPDAKAGGDWICPVEFRGTPRGLLPNRTQVIHGVDALQALVLAIGYAQLELTGLQRKSRGALTWLGSHDLGLPDIIGLIGVRTFFRSTPRRR